MLQKLFHSSLKNKDFYNISGKYHEKHPQAVKSLQNLALGSGPAKALSHPSPRGLTHPRSQKLQAELAAAPDCSCPGHNISISLCQVLPHSVSIKCTTAPALISPSPSDAPTDTFPQAMNGIPQSCGPTC